MAPRAFRRILLAATLVYPALLAASAWRPAGTLLLVWQAERVAGRLLWVAPLLLAAAAWAIPAVGERLSDAGRAIRAAFTADRREIAELSRNAAEIANPYWPQKLGEAYLRRLRFREAEAAFRTACGRDPSAANGHYLRGRCLLKLRRPAEAAEALGRALALDPSIDFGHGPLFLAEALLGAGRTGEGIARARAFLAGAGSHPRGRWVLGRLLARAGDRGGARAEMRGVVEAVRAAPRFARREHRFVLRRARRWLLFHPGPAVPGEAR